MSSRETDSGRVINVNTGRTGWAVGREDRGGTPYVRVRFSDYDSLIPEELFASTYKEQGLSVEEGRYPDLRAHIKRTRKFGDLTEDSSSLPKVEEIIEEARRRDLLYRCDLRPPFGQTGIFRIGFGIRSTKGAEYEFVSTTTSLAYALTYPDSSDIPGKWNGIKYVYVIDPFNESIEKGQFGSPDSNDIMPLAEEIDYDFIPPSAIIYAMKYNHANGAFKKIYTNP